MARKKAYKPAFKKAPFRKFNSYYGPQRSIGLSHRAELKVCDVTSADALITMNSASGVSTAVDNTTAAATHQIACLNTMAQGTDFTGRVGRKICCKSILLDIEFMPIIADSPEQGEIARVVLFWDLQSNGATTFTLSNLFLDNSASATSGTTAPVNLNNRDRFKILMDKRIAFPACKYTANVVTAGSPVAKNFKKYIKLGSVTTTFNDVGTGVYGDVSSGALMLLVYGENGSAISFLYSARCRFIDA